jgi:hypothetical protein
MFNYGITEEHGKKVVMYLMDLWFELLLRGLVRFLRDKVTELSD